LSNVEHPDVRFISGVIMPVVPSPVKQDEPLLPPDVIEVTTPLGITDYTNEAVNEAMLRYWDCVEKLQEQKAQRVTICGFPIAAQMGRKYFQELAEETERRAGIPGDSDAEATVAAMHHLGVKRVAMASRWADELNEGVKVFLADAGIETLTTTSEGQWARQAFSMSIEQGIKLAIELGRKAMKQAPQADGLFLPGGVWRSLAVVPFLEGEFGVPVFTNPISMKWRLMSLGIAPAVQGWGRLLASA
jgi:arylmalonate decarboxylase